MVHRPLGGQSSEAAVEESSLKLISGIEKKHMRSLGTNPPNLSGSPGDTAEASAFRSFVITA